jgi:hypothetical protein
MQEIKQQLAGLLEQLVQQRACLRQWMTCMTALLVTTTAPAKVGLHVLLVLLAAAAVLAAAVLAAAVLAAADSAVPQACIIILCSCCCRPQPHSRLAASLAAHSSPHCVFAAHTACADNTGAQLSQPAKASETEELQQQHCTWQQPVHRAHTCTGFS